MRILLTLSLLGVVGCDNGGQIECRTPEGARLLFFGHYDKEIEWGYVVKGDSIYSKSVCSKLPPIKELK